MFLAEKMDLVTILVLKRDMEAVLDEIASTGLMQPARIEEMETWAGELAPADGGEKAAAASAMQKRIVQLLGDRYRECRAQAFAEAGPVRPVPENGLETAVAGMEAELQPLLNERETVEARLNEARGRFAKNAMLLESGVPLAQLGKSTHLIGVAGVIEEVQFRKLTELLWQRPALVIPYEKRNKELHVLCVVLRKDRDFLESALKGVSFRETAGMEEFSKAPDAALAREAIPALEQERDALEEKIDAVRRRILPELAEPLRNTEATLLLSHVRGMCRATEQSCLLAGWTPARDAAGLVEAIRARVGNRALVEAVPAEQVDKVVQGTVAVPVSFAHPGFLRPFDWLVETYGVPSYRMIDPTLISFIAFLVMFGMMFGDLGHGAVLVFAGATLAVKAPKWRNLGAVLLYAGASACIFGLLFGSVFGIETLIPALWVHPVERINTVFTAAIAFGVFMLTCGVVLNTINAVRTRTFASGFFESAGPLGGIIYWIGILIAVKLVASSMDVSRLGIELTVFFALLLLYFVKEPVRRLLWGERPRFPGGVVTCLIEGAVEVLELLMGYLANTLSFVRVAAFGLAHAGLLVAVFGISELAAHWPAGTFFSVLILVVGNAVVIVFEGAVVTIQILRLQYYEFFSKFFKEFGVKYRPVHYAGALTDGAG